MKNCVPLCRIFDGLFVFLGILVLAAIFLIGTFASVEARNHRETKEVVVPEGYWKIGAYDVRLLGNFFHFVEGGMTDPETGEPEYLRSEHRLLILREGILLDEAEDHTLDLSPWPRKDYTPPLIGANVIGTGTPNLIVYGYSGGAHCCSTTHIYDLGDEFRKVAMIDTGDYDLKFKQLDSDPALEIEVIESIFQYWRAGPSDAVRPVVILKLNAEKNRYAFSPVLMRRSPSAESELRAEADAVRALPVWVKHRRPPPRLWEVMLDLIYGGNYPLARPFFDRAWNDRVAGKEEFWNEMIKCQMRHSEFWSDVAALNGLAAAKPEGECPGSQ